MKHIFLWLLFSFAAAKLDISKYQLTFEQDFTKITNLSVTGNYDGPCGTGNGEYTWMSHTNGKDYVNFINPSGNYKPFSLDNGHLTIRTVVDGSGKAYGGMLNTVDNKGNGFSQKWGYYEASMKFSNVKSSWPAFWLLDVTSLKNGGATVGTEIDVIEQYGDSPGVYTAMHIWSNGHLSRNGGHQHFTLQCSMFSGFHKYGVDYQEDYITFYFDRIEYWRIPNSWKQVDPESADGKWDQPLYMLINNAYEGGISTNPNDLQVEYVKAWSGTGGSDGINDYSSQDSFMWGCFNSPDVNNFELTPSKPFKLNGVTLQLTTTGDLRVVDCENNILWNSSSTADCSAAGACSMVLQCDGNWVMKGGNWASGTWGKSGWLGVQFFNTPPYLRIVNNNECNTIWEAKDAKPSNVKCSTPVPTPPVPTSTTTSPNTPNGPSASNCNPKNDYVNGLSSLSSVTFPTTKLNFTASTPVNIKGASLKVSTSGSVMVVDGSGNTLWSSGSSADCSKPSDCQVLFQNDGNFVLYASGKAVWGTNTYDNFDGYLILSNSAPYVQITDGSCNLLYSTFSSQLSSGYANNTMVTNSSVTVGIQLAILIICTLLAFNL